MKDAVIVFDTPPAVVHTVSDLHLFCRRSHWKEHQPRIQETAAGSDLFVFNGDTVDFRWTSHPDAKTTVAHARQIFVELMEAAPCCHIHVNLGNHDHHQLLMGALEELEREYLRFSWHPYYLRVGRAVFLHGDVLQAPHSQEQLERDREAWLHHEPWGKLPNLIFDSAFRLRAHHLVTRWHFPRKRSLDRLIQYLETIRQGAAQGVTQVYFGHTHLPMQGVAYKGLTFHNSGAALWGVPFHILQAKI